MVNFGSMSVLGFGFNAWVSRALPQCLGVPGFAVPGFAGLCFGFVTGLYRPGFRCALRLSHVDELR